MIINMLARLSSARQGRPHETALLCFGIYHFVDAVWILVLRLSWRRLAGSGQLAVGRAEVFHTAALITPTQEQHG